MSQQLLQQIKNLESANQVLSAKFVALSQQFLQLSQKVSQLLQQKQALSERVSILEQEKKKLKSITEEMKNLVDNLPLYQSEELKKLMYLPKAPNGWGKYDYNPISQDCYQEPNHQFYCVNKKVNMIQNHKKTINILKQNKHCSQVLKFGQNYLAKLRQWQKVFEGYTQEVIKNRWTSQTAKPHLQNQINYRKQRLAQIKKWIIQVRELI